MVTPGIHVVWQTKWLGKLHGFFTHLAKDPPSSSGLADTFRHIPISSAPLKKSTIEFSLKETQIAISDKEKQLSIQIQQIDELRTSLEIWDYGVGWRYITEGWGNDNDLGILGL